MCDCASRAGHDGAPLVAKAAAACEAAGLHSQAVGWRRELLRRAEEGGEGGGAKVAAAAVGLAECLAKGGGESGGVKESKEAVGVRREEAIGLLRKAVSLSESLFGRDHPLAAARKRRLADALIQLNEHLAGADGGAATAAAKEEARSLLAAALPPLRAAATSSAAAAQELRMCEESAERLAK